MAILKDYSKENTLNLSHLNQTRKSSGSYRKVRVGVYEEQYLTTMWKMKNMKFDLIEITRTETIRKYFDYMNKHGLY